jgi:PKD repeat protein
MKSKLYASLIFSICFSAAAVAQCAITSSSVTPSGLTVNATMTATGASLPGYGWDWGDASQSYQQNDSHTYASAGTYTVCAVYIDLSNASCNDSACHIVTVTAVGIADPTVAPLMLSASPNPFGNTLNIQIDLTQSQDVSIDIYDVTGQLVATVYSGSLAAGQHRIEWNSTNMAEGVYFLQVKTGDSVQTKKIVHTTK